MQNFFDFALPEDNEEKLIEKYIEYKYKYVVFLYRVSKLSDLKIFKEIKEYPKINIYLGAIIDNDDVKKTMKLSAELFYNKNLFNDLVFVLAKDFNYNRKILQRYFYNGLANPGYIYLEDTPLFRYIAIPTKFIKKIVENRQAVLFSIRELKENYKYLGRVLYLSKILQKKDVPILLGSFASKPEEVPRKVYLVAFKKLLKVKYSNYLVFWDFIIKQINRTRKAKNPYVFMEGFEIIKTPYEDGREY